MEKKITAHCLVKNEARFVWYAVGSVINYVDEILLWDGGGSTDGTVEIIREIEKKYPTKVKTRFIKEMTAENFPEVRQQMLDETKSEWFLVLDGDEIWWEESIATVIDFLRNKSQGCESVVVPFINLVGDIFHYQEEAAGKYRLVGKKGHFSLRAASRGIPGLSSAEPHGTWGWVDGEGKMIQDRDRQKIKFLDCPYLHATHLRRSGKSGGDEQVMKRKQKLKYEIGKKFASDYYYPEVFFRPRPKIVDSVWEKMTKEFYLKSLWQTPFKRLKRRIFFEKVGY